MIKIFFCFVLLIILSNTASVKSEEDTARKAISEQVGRSDPFERIKPIIQAQQKLVESEPAYAAPEIPEEPKPDLFVETVMMKFLTADNFEVAARAMLTKWGAVSVDQQTNTLIICDTRENVDKMLDQVRQADQTPLQIMIEVVIIDVKLQDDTEIGVDWNHVFGRAVADYRPNTFDEPWGGATTDYSSALFDSVGAVGIADAASGIALSMIQDRIMVTLRALQQTQNFEILANPKILVVSGQEAEIKTIEEIPYEERSETSEGGQLTSTEFKEIGITLTVKATVMDDGKILITIIPEQSSDTGRTGQGSGNSDIPIVDKRQARTTLLMDDGQVFVMGGLRRKEKKITQSKVPLLGDMPIVGSLFSNDQTIERNSELLVLIAPRIHKGEPLTPYQQEKFDEIRSREPLYLPDDRPLHKALNDNIPNVGSENAK